jgi:pimeloyl-ACP methyl ester carboxylesterase
LVLPVIRTTTVVAESARYTPAVLYLSGLWGSPAQWGNLPSALANRGWEGAFVEFVGEADGGIGARAEALATHARGLVHPPVLVGHDAGALLALATAARVPVAALVLVAPLLPGCSPRLLVRRLDALAALVRRRPVPAPGASLVARVLGLPPDGFALGSRPEPTDVVLDVLRGRVPIVPPPAATPTLLVAGTADPHLPTPRAAALAARLGAELQQVVDAGHWLPLESSWQTTAAAIHRWLVQRLGEAVLELHAEAMGERGQDADDDPDD